jgi:hypothetical protein
MSNKEKNKMKRKDKIELEQMLNGFESILREFDIETNTDSLDDLIKRISTMDAGLSIASFEIMEA